MLGNKKHSLADDIDEGYRIKTKIKELENKSDEIKVKLRKAALQEDGSIQGSGDTVILQGNQYKAKVCLSEDSFSFCEGSQTTDIRRVKAVIGSDAMLFEEGVKLKEGMTLAKIKSKLGDLYNELFEDNITTKLDAQKLTEWLKQRKKMASLDNSAEFVETHLKRKPNTPKVTFTKS